MRSEILLIVAAIGFLPGASRGQESGGAVACPSIENSEDRLACYDRAMRGTVHAPEPVAAAPAPTSAAVAAPAAVVAASAASAAPTAVVAPAAATPSSTISTAPHNARSTQPPPQPGAPPTFDPVSGAPIGIVPIVVLSAVSRPGFGTQFTTDQGAVWTQTDTKPLTLPKTPFNAQLQPGTFGSTFLVVPDRKLGVRVRPPGK